MSKILDEETKEIISSFIAEGFERLDDAEAQLGKLGEGDEISRLNSVFRLFHSVKGSAGYLNFENIKILTHQAEALLEVFIKKKVPTSPESLDVIFQTVDSLRELIKLVEREFDDSAGAEKAASQAALVREYAEVLLTGHETGESPVSPAASAPSENPPSRPEPVSDTPNEIFLNELVAADMVERFLAESTDLADAAERGALVLGTPQALPDTLNEIFRAIHTIKGNAGFFGHSLLERLCMDFETLLDGARKGSIQVNEGFASSAMARIDVIRSAVATVRIRKADEDPNEPSASPGSYNSPVPPRDESRSAFQKTTRASVSELPDALSPGFPPFFEATESRPLSPRKILEVEPPLIDLYKPIGEILVEMGAAPEEAIQKALDQQIKPLGEILVENGAVKQEDLNSALAAQRKAVGVERPQAEEIQRKEIRVDTAKLDKLFDLVGELITAEAMVGNSPDLAGLKLDLFQKSFSGLSKISREIQETTMMIRMIPLEGLFQKMTRLVRDLSRKFDKAVDFSVAGAETEMDKNVIEQISDPLVHILRNALDHGLESSKQRLEAGKKEIGHLHLDARYEGSEIWISIKDDGAGLSRERILAKAIEKGLIKAEDSDTITDKDLWSLIFEPGFSTAAKVTEVSGRGVGMDVVKKNLERIRGKVDIITTKGQGSEFILKIPLTMAIIEGITVKVGQGFYSIPLGDIIEFFKVTSDKITVTSRGEETINLRGQLLPLVKLGEVFQIAGAIDDPTVGIVIVVQSAGMSACILIDEVVGNQQIVVKSISEYLGKVEGISGCSILGDGTVSFIVDTARLIARRLE